MDFIAQLGGIAIITYVCLLQLVPTDLLLLNHLAR
jgi:hypothetical protein